MSQFQFKSFCRNLPQFLLSDHWPAKHKRWSPCSGSCATQVRRTCLVHIHYINASNNTRLQLFLWRYHGVRLRLPLHGQQGGEPLHPTYGRVHSGYIYESLPKGKTMSNIPFQFNQTIFVSREGADSRSKAVNMIKERVGTWSLQEIKFNLSWRSFHPFPGHSLLFGLRALALIGNKSSNYNSNATTAHYLWVRKALMQFKPGAFIPGAPVQPVLIRYHVPQHMVQHCVILLAPVIWQSQDTVTWTWDQPYGALTCIFLSLSQWSIR